MTAPRKVPESPTRMTKVGMERRSCVRDVAEFNLQSLAMDGREEEREDNFVLG